MMANTRAILLLVALSCALAAFAQPSGMASVTVYAKNLADFNTAAGSPPVAIGFDDIMPGTNITGTKICGVTFSGPGAPLIVVRGADTYTPSGFSGAPHPETNKLLPTTGENVLSPGGVELRPGSSPAFENDDLTLVFDEPVSAFGFDHISQSCDGTGYTSIVVKDKDGATLYSGRVSISNLGGGGAPGGADFWGIVSTSANIKTIVIDEGDSNAQYPDCNIGFDTLRFFSPTPAVGLNGRAVRDSVVTAAGGRKFVVWGHVTVIDASSFLVDDGSAKPVKVVAAGYSGLADGDYARAMGTIDNSVDPPILTSTATDVNKL